MTENCKALTNLDVVVERASYDRTSLISESHATLDRAVVTGPRSSLIALVPLDRDARASLREQVYAGIRELIVSGRITRGALLPSTRALSSELGVSRNTVIAAFDQLTAEGYVSGRSGAGSFVNERLPDELV